MKMNTRRFIIILTAVTLLLLGSGLRADTIITDPKGGTLCFGKSTVKVDFGRANFDAELAKLHNTECLVMGVIDGRVVVANLDQTVNGPSQNKLFCVNLLGDGKAAFSGLVSDRINVTGNMTLANFIKTEKYNLAEKGYIPNNIRIVRGQLLAWTGKKLDGTAAQYILMTDQYQQGISVFEYRPVMTSGEQTNIHEVHFVRNILLPGPYTNHFVNVLDGIDPNAFRASGNTKEYPKTLAVWCKPDRRTGYSNTQLVAPTELLSCSVDDAVTELKIASHTSFPYDPFGPGTRFSQCENMLTGFMTAPNADGKLSYWACKLRFYQSMGSSSYAYSDVFVMPVVLSGNELRLGDKTVKCIWEKDFGNRYANLRQKWQEYGLDNPGLRVLFKKRSDNEVGITPALMPDSETYHRGNDKIGVCDALSSEELQMLNSKVSILGGVVPNSMEERMKRYARVQGWTVLRVFQGQPYLIAPESLPGGARPAKIYNQCSIAYGYEKTQLYEYSFNNGVMLSDTTAMAGKDLFFSKFEIGLKSTWEQKTNNVTNTEVTVGVNTEQRASEARSFDEGTVVFTQIKPRVGALAKIVPTKEAPTLSLQGDPAGKFQLVLVNSSLQQPVGTTAVQFQKFMCTNPAVTLEGSDGNAPIYRDFEDCTGKAIEPKLQTPYSVLSAGLLERPFSSLISTRRGGDPVVDETIGKILNWQSSNDVIADLQQFNSELGGVSAYAQAVKEGSDIPVQVDNGELRDSFSATTKYSVVRKDSSKLTRSHQKNLSYYWKLDLGLLTKDGSVETKVGTETVNTDTTKHKFDFGIGGWDGAPVNNQRSYYFFWVDIPTLKSYMASHTYELRAGANKGKYTNEVHRPGFIPIYCWENDQSFQLGVPWIPMPSQAKPSKTVSSSL
ncbi:MAG: hypothetical protein WAL87_04835 [Chthoniobacterales bacterium]